MSSHPRITLHPAKKRGWSFIWENKKLSSQYDPIKEAENLKNNFREKLRSAKQVIFVGCFPLYHIHLIQASCPHLDCFILNDLPIADDEIQKLWSVVQKDFPKKISLAKFKFLDSEKKAVDFLSQQSKEKIDKTLIIPSPYAEPKISKNLQAHHIKLLEKKKIEVQTINQFLPLWHLHTLINLKYHAKNFIESIELTSTLPREDFPVILISSGWGLDDFLRLHRKDLTEFAKSYPVISVPGIAGRLQDLSIPITALITTDAGFSNTYHLAKLFYQQQDLPLVAPLSIHPMISRNWKRIFFYWDLEEHRDILSTPLGEKNYIPIDASVTLSGLRYLEKQGFSRIYTVGIDFTISPFQEHALSNTSQETLFNRNTRLYNFTTATHRLFHQNILSSDFPESLPTATEANHHGEMNFPNQVLKLYRNQFKKITARLKAKGVEVENWQNIPWQKYLNTPNKCRLTFNNEYLSGRSIYHQIKDQFRKIIIPGSPVPMPDTRKNWLWERWRRL